MCILLCGWFVTQNHLESCVWKAVGAFFKKKIQPRWLNGPSVLIYHGRTLTNQINQPYNVVKFLFRSQCASTSLAAAVVFFFFKETITSHPRRHTSTAHSVANSSSSWDADWLEAWQDGFSHHLVTLPVQLPHKVMSEVTINKKCLKNEYLTCSVEVNDRTTRWIQSTSRTS